MTVYLLHFDDPLPGEPAYPLSHARHYLGVTDDLEARLELHRQGRGARLVAVAIQSGLTFRLARTWSQADRTLERKLKNRHEGPALCPICRGAS